MEAIVREHGRSRSACRGRVGPERGGGPARGERREPALELGRGEAVRQHPREHERRAVDVVHAAQRGEGVRVAREGARGERAHLDRRRARGAGAGRQREQGDGARREHDDAAQPGHRRASR